MKNLFDNPILIKLQAFGQKLGQNKFLNALQTGMMSTMAPIMVGAICQILCSLGTMLNLFTNDSAIYKNLYYPYEFTMNSLLGVWVVVFVAYNYAKNLKMKSPISVAVDTAIVFLLCCGPIASGAMTTTFLGAMGLFPGFVISFVVVRIEKFCADKNLRIPLPDVCPPSLVNSFAAIIPLALNVILFQGLNVILASISGGALTVPTAIMAVLSAPLSAVNSIPGMFIIVLFGLILWCFGIHGTMIIYPFLMASMIEAAMTNAQLHAAGEPLVFFPVALFACMSVCGGTGNTLALCIMGLRSKSKQIRAISKVAIVPNWFGINEPVVFGFPIMYNPILCIPYVLNVMVVMALYVVAYKTGIIIPAWISIQSLMPVGFGAYFGTLNIMNFIWVYLMLIPVALVYYPFFKVYEKQLVAQEQAAEAAEAAEAAQNA